MCNHFVTVLFVLVYLTKESIQHRDAIGLSENLKTSFHSKEMNFIRRKRKCFT